MVSKLNFLRLVCKLNLVFGMGEKENEKPQKKGTENHIRIV